MSRITTSGTGGASLVGVPPTDINAIARWDDTIGKIIKNSPGTLVQDSGAIEASGFLTNRNVTTVISIPAEYSCIAPELEIELTGSIEIELDGGLIII